MIFVLFLFVSCKSKKNVVDPASPCAQCRFRPSDSSAAIDGLFAPDHSQLKELKVSTKKAEENSEEKKLRLSRKNVIWYFAEQRSRLSTVNVPATYSGMLDRVVEYDFTHRDVPEAFEGFRIAFISDLHYKSLLKEKGLNNLVDLFDRCETGRLADGRDYQEGCEYRTVILPHWPV